MNIQLNTRDYIVRDLFTEVDEEGLLQVHVRLHHKDLDPASAKIYKYAARLSKLAQEK